MSLARPNRSAQPDPQSSPAVRTSLQRPEVSDASRIHRLISECPPLDLNSTYAYLLLCHHFADTCVIARQGGRVVGFVSAYRPPAREDVIFVWQVAVDASQRGTGLGRAMLRELLARPALAAVDVLETTVSPSNEASRRMFRAVADELGGSLGETPLFTREHFGGEAHEDEVLVRIGGLVGRSHNSEETKDES